VRRYLRWYINPIVEQQNAANAAFTAALLAMLRVDAERRAEIASLRSKTRRQGDRETSK
jgi:5'-deoxynucleotidase YfbR-like HD superfamily hydrolase